MSRLEADWSLLPSVSSKLTVAQRLAPWETLRMSKVRDLSLVSRGVGLVCLWYLCGPISLAAQTNQSVYGDTLQNGWQNWSWATVNLANSSPVHSGSSSISVSSTNWQALYLHHAAQSGAVFTNLTFWINGGSVGGQIVQVQAARSGVTQPPVVLAALPANVWRQETVSLTALGVATAADLDGFWLQVQNAGLAPTFYVDDMTLVGTTNTTPPPVVTNISVALTINAAQNQRPISPLIYGVAFADASQLNELNAPLNRWGGNSTTRYNWFLNADNKASDWYFQSLPQSSATPGAAADDFISATKSGGSQPIITVPMIDWMPKLGPNRRRLSSYSIAKYGGQTGSDWQWFPDAGNGVSTNNNTPITWNDPNDANYLTNSAFQKEWVKHLTNAWGRATNGGVRYYCLDNEYALWNSTHRDVHPVGATMQEICSKMMDYGAKVKAIDPNAQLLGPEEWGWPGYLYSGYDWQWASDNSNWNPASFPDRIANGGMDFGPWLLQQMKQYELTNGTRLLDVFTLHIYPQGANEASSDANLATQLGRNRSTRALWDTNYVDNSWINSTIRLIPRLREWVTNYYPGTKIGITEYNWGAEDHINGATAQADALGIFGREGLDLATRWTTPNATSPAFKAMKMYRNYDGNKSTFGETSVAASGPNPDLVSCFAALRADGALTIMAINKQPDTNATATITFTNYLSAGVAQVWRLTAANIIASLSALSFTGNSFTNDLPAQSITLFVLPSGSSPQLSNMSAHDGLFEFQLNGLAGQRYAILGSSNLVNWLPLQTNALASGAQTIAFGITNAQRFYRAQRVP